MEKELRKYYLSEFSYFDGDHNITFNIVGIDMDKKEITIAITDEGKISVPKFDLKIEDGHFFFEYGVMREKIAVDDFEQVEENKN